jgi:Protein of unknown function (DUF2628)
MAFLLFPAALSKALIMALYSVHLQGTGLEAAAEAAFVRQAFNWKAFFFGPFWLARHRLWGALALWVAAFVLLTASLGVLPAASAFFMALAFQILLGLEAGALREAKLASQGYHLAEIIAAPSTDQAEAAFFRRLETPDSGLSDAGPAEGPGSGW